MKSARASVRAAFVLAPLGLALCQAGSARAGGLTFEPVYLHLTASAPATSLRLANRGNKTMRYQVAPYAWTQSPTGETQLAATEEVMVFPVLFSLAPGEERMVRIGTTAQFGATERTFRVVVDEFPTEADGAMLKIRSRVILPLFLDPESPAATSRVESAAVHGKDLNVELRSTGNTHVLFTGFRAIPLAADGSPLHEHRWGPGYLLSGGKLVLTAAVPKGLCQKVRSIRVEAQLAATDGVRMAPVERTVPAAGSCTP